MSQRVLPVVTAAVTSFPWRNIPTLFLEFNNQNKYHYPPAELTDIHAHTHTRTHFHGNTHERILAESISCVIDSLGIVESVGFQQQLFHPSHLSPASSHSLSLSPSLAVVLSSLEYQVGICYVEHMCIFFVKLFHYNYPTAVKTQVPHGATW